VGHDIGVCMLHVLAVVLSVRAAVPRPQGLANTSCSSGHVGRSMCHREWLDDAAEAAAAVATGSLAAFAVGCIGCVHWLNAHSPIDSVCTMLSQVAGVTGVTAVPFPLHAATRHV